MAEPNLLKDQNGSAGFILGLALLSLIAACGGAERGGGPVLSSDTTVTAGLPFDLTFQPGEVVTPTPVVRVTDGVGRPLAGVPVAFALIEGGGTQ